LKFVIWNLTNFIFEKQTDKINPCFVNYLRDTILVLFKEVRANIAFPRTGDDNHDGFAAGFRTPGYLKGRLHRRTGGDAADNAFQFGQLAGGFKGIIV
jgi:hypothetical protein